MRFCVVALNPAIDAEWCVEDVLWEEKNVVHAQRRWPGGKGPNVARWLKFLGTDSELLIPLGGATGREMASGLRAWRDEFHESPPSKGSGTRGACPSSAKGALLQIIRLREETRVNVVVTTARGRQMRFNPPGPKLNAREWRAVLHAASAMVARGRSLILSGALPRGVPVNAYAQLIRIAHRSGQRTFLDCDGEALIAGARAKPFFIKPNAHELSRWAGRKLNSDRSLLAAARKLSLQTGGWILVSLGADGGLLVNAHEGFSARAAAPDVQVVNTVGAGDAMLAAAAQAVARDSDPIHWLSAAVAAGTAATQCRAGDSPSQTLLRRFQRCIEVRLI